jgi:polysaccharide export outer membrane protein
MKKRILTALIVMAIFILNNSVNYADESREQYSIGIDDVLEINVLGHDNLKTNTPIAADGTISFPYIGSINVKGMSLPEIEKEITQRLSNGYIKYPTVSVALASSKSKKYFVYGEVKNPGRYVLEFNMTVLKAISAAGGITPDGLFGSVKLRRRYTESNGIAEFNIDIKNTREKKLNGDMPLEPEDIVIVERSKDFFVYGEVVKPGKFVLEDNMTVLKAISVAGGFAKFGSPDRVRILRGTTGSAEYENIKVNIKGAVNGHAENDIHLEPGDIVVVLEGIL